MLLFPYFRAEDNKPLDPLRAPPPASTYKKSARNKKKQQQLKAAARSKMMSESPIAADAESVDNMSLPGEWDNMSSGIPGSPFHYDGSPHHPYNNMPPGVVYDPNFAHPQPHMMDPAAYQQSLPMDPAYYQQQQQAMYQPAAIGMPADYAAAQQQYAPPQHLTQPQAFLPPGADPSAAAAAAQNMQQQPHTQHNQNSAYPPGPQQPQL